MRKAAAWTVNVRAVALITVKVVNMYDFHSVYKDVEKATALVAHLNEKEEDGWSYKLLLTSDKSAAVIEIYDEDGHLVSLL
jgi:hypothetical protein